MPIKIVIPVMWLQMMLVLECMGGGDLSRALRRDSISPREFGWHNKGRFILLGIARGLAYIHSRKVNCCRA